MQPQPSFPISVSCFIVDDRERLLLFSRDGAAWRVMGGQLEQNETISECIQREIREELGAIRYRLVDVLDAHIFAYPQLGSIVSVFCLLKYEEGDIAPASDMSEYSFRWIEAEQALSMNFQCPYQKEIVEKAINVFRQFRTNSDLGFWKFRWRSPS